MAETLSPSRPRKGRSLARRVRWLAGTVASVLFGLIVLLPAGMGFVTLGGVTHPRCAYGPLPDAYGLDGEDVSVPSRLGVAFPGYFFPGTNGATIIVPPAYGQDRGGLLHEVDVLVRAGFSVLTYDSRNCLGLAPHSLGVWEAEDILDAVAYLHTRGDVDTGRLGVHGFSQAGASGLLAAARTSEIRAVAAEGGYVDYGAQTLSLDRASDLFTTLFGLGAQLGYRAATGLGLESLRPVAVLSDIAPRAVLLIYGEYENTLAGARQVAAENDHVRLWEVPGATHGSYLRSAEEDVFRAEVAGFFEEVLVSGQ